MTRTNGLYLMVGALAVLVVGLGSYIYQQETQQKGVELSISKNGVSVEEK